MHFLKSETFANVLHVSRDEPKSLSIERNPFPAKNLGILVLMYLLMYLECILVLCPSYNSGHLNILLLRLVN